MSFGAAFAIGLAGIVMVLVGAARLVAEDCADASCSGAHATGVALMVGGGACLVLAVVVAVLTELRRK